MISKQVGLSQENIATDTCRDRKENLELYYWSTIVFTAGGVCGTFITRVSRVLLMRHCWSLRRFAAG